VFFLAGEDRKVLVIGLDCATPQLVFDRWIHDLPHFKQIQKQSVYGELESTIPPITVPAWTSMMSSKSPGVLGFYGFRNRKNYSYDEMYFATSQAVKEDRVWDILSRTGKKCILVGVPQTYPPKPLNGLMISGFLAPDAESQYTYPGQLKEEIEKAVGEYILDVKKFRTEDKDDLIKQIYQMTENRFAVVNYLMERKEWDFFMFVEMGIDRIHHGLWKYFDEEHKKYDPDSPYRGVLKEYYQFVDDQVGHVLEGVDDQTVVLIVSDHGAQRMEGGICINEWLMREGYLTLKSIPHEVTQLRNDNIDWPRTMAWGSGGYYGRLFLNVKGREPQGVIEAQDYEGVRDELIAKLGALEDENGVNIGTRVFKPQDIYPQVKNVAPDLIVYFGNLSWRSVGSVGFGDIRTFENDTGPDDANHSQHGIFVMRGSGLPAGYRSGLHLMDVAPTILNIFDLPIPEDMEGKSII
jgi:predicted AlkP superfamily phosphohydrolase/phosphomutase